MKRNLTLIATVMMMVLSLSSFATEKISPAKDLASNTLISNYLDASVLGKQKLVKNMLAENFEFINTSDNSKSTKKEYSKFLDKTNNLTYDCTTSYEVLDQSGNAAVAKVTMKFENFTRVDLINMSNTAEGWKINQVISNFL